MAARLAGTDGNGSPWARGVAQLSDRRAFGGYAPLAGPATRGGYSHAVTRPRAHVAQGELESERLIYECLRFAVGAAGAVDGEAREIAKSMQHGRLYQAAKQECQRIAQAERVIHGGEQHQQQRKRECPTATCG